MPQLIEHIDAIARKKQRDVLFIRFSDPFDLGNDWDEPTNTWDWRSSTVRQTVTSWTSARLTGAPVAMLPVRTA